MSLTIAEHTEVALLAAPNGSRLRGAEAARIGRYTQAVVEELVRAIAKHGPMKSDREANDVIAEEVDELRLAIWYGVDQHGAPADPRAEAVQVAAMAIRYLVDLP